MGESAEVEPRTAAELDSMPLAEWTEGEFFAIADDTDEVTGEPESVYGADEIADAIGGKLGEALRALYCVDEIADAIGGDLGEELGALDSVEEVADAIGGDLGEELRAFHLKRVAELADAISGELGDALRALRPKPHRGNGESDE